MKQENTMHSKRPKTQRTAAESNKPHSKEAGKGQATPRIVDVRMEKVEAVRRTIQANGYENDGVLDEIVRRMTDEFGAIQDSSGEGRRLRYRRAADGST